MQPDYDYLGIMRKLGEPFLGKIPSLREEDIPILGEVLFQETMRHFSDQKFGSREEMQEFLKGNLEIQEIMKKAKSIFGPFIMIHAMRDQTKVRWHTV